MIPTKGTNCCPLLQKNVAIADYKLRTFAHFHRLPVNRAAEHLYGVGSARFTFGTSSIAKVT